MPASLRTHPHAMHALRAQRLFTIEDSGVLPFRHVSTTKSFRAPPTLNAPAERNDRVGRRALRRQQIFTFPSRLLQFVVVQLIVVIVRHLSCNALPQS